MRPAIQVKAISSQLEILEEFKSQLENVLDYTNHVIEKGKSWIEETIKEKFLEMNKFLTDEILESFRKCRNITKDLNEECNEQTSLQDQDKGDNESVNTLKTSKTPQFKEEKTDKELFEKYQEIEKTISLQSKRMKQIEQKLLEMETKETISREQKENEDHYNMKFDELLEELDKANNVTSDLQSQNKGIMKQVKEHDKQMSSFIKTLHSIQKQINEHEEKSETFMKQQKSTENSCNLRLDELMKDILEQTESINELKYDSETLLDTTIPKLQEKLTDVIKHNAVIESTCQKTEEGNRNKFDDIYNVLESIDKKDKGKLKDLEKHIEDIETASKEEEKCNSKKFDDVYKKMKSTDLQQKILSVSSEVDSLSKQLVLSRQQAFFFAKAEGAMNVQMNLRLGQIINSFCLVLNNIGKHYDPLKGIFTAPCNGLYLYSYSLKCDIGENAILGVIVKETTGSESKSGSVQISTVKSNSSLTAPLSLKQNDQVYIASRGNYTQIKLDIRSYFMCSLICRT